MITLELRLEMDEIDIKEVTDEWKRSRSSR